MLDWGRRRTSGSAQFELPYFMFRPLHGKLVWEDSAKYQTDADEIARMGIVFDQILRSGDMSCPIPAKEVRAVFALQEAAMTGDTVDLVVGLLQSGDDGRGKPLHSGFRLADAKVVSVTPRGSGGAREELYYLASLKGRPVRDLRSFDAPA